MPVYRLSADPIFPDPELAESSGLIAVGGDLSPRRLITAYSLGIFPWYSEGEPIMWFSPNPRMVLEPHAFQRSKTLLRLIRSGKYELKIDAAFPEVIRHCAKTPRKDEAGTWITDEMQSAYIELHRLGLAHSFETYFQGELVGGLYGISLGNAFFGESMFHHARDASKFAFNGLVAFCLLNGFEFIDAQQPTPHLASLGAQEVPRQKFLQSLAGTQHNQTLQGSWSSYLPELVLL